MSSVSNTKIDPKRKLILLSDISAELEQIIQPVPTSTTLINWIESGNLDGVKISGRWYVRLASFEELIQKLAASEPASTAL